MTLLAIGIALILAGGLTPAVFARTAAGRDRLTRALIVSGCIVGLVPAVVLLASSVPEAGSPVGAPNDGAAFGLDRLSAWFVVIVLGVGGPVAAYGVSYLASERGQRPVALAHALLSALLTGLVGVVTATTVVAFLASWEVMALSAYFLVMFESEKAEVRRAGFIYVVLTHLATLALLGMFAAWSPTDTTTTFAALAERARSGPVASGLILGLASLAFAIKAGVVPAHFWLPGAHAAAPSHVSALLSGVMLKTGVYGLLRVLTLLGSPPIWWGWMLLLLGLLSSVLGVLWALGQHDLKRLLAYHSVENVGIIFLGVGIGVLGAGYDQPTLAALGYTAALLHTLNHALFKSLLFLGAGAIGAATGIRVIDRLGGLVRAMPRTAVLFAIGSLAIVGLPPFNGFVSEWMVFQSLLDAGRSEPALRPAVMAAAGLAMTGALALACFAKIFATMFLGHARERVDMTPSETVKRLERPQYLLATACVLLGIVPALAVLPAARVSATDLGTGPLPVAAAQAIVPLTGLFIGLILAVFGFLILRRPRARRAAPMAPTWGCAYPLGSARMQYTASSFASPILRAFGPLAAVHDERTAAVFRQHPFDLVLDRLGRPAWRRVQDASTRLRFLQAGRIRWYLLYLILTVAALLIYLASELPA